MQQKTILIVGGAGYIGSYVNKLLHSKGFHTIVFDNLSQGSKKSVVRGDFILGDTNNTKDLNKIFSSCRIDAVMHFAAHISVGESIKNPKKYYRNNVVNTLNLLEAMLQYNISKFIFSSTAAIFGSPKEIPIKEEHPYLPINPYGQSKLMIEKILQDFTHSYAFQSCSLRYFNAAGGDPEGEIKHPQREETNLIPLILRNLLKKDASVSIFGTDYNTPDGTCIRDYIHIHDLAAAHISALEQLFNGAPSNVYNLGNGKGFSVQEVIDAVENITGFRIHRKNSPRREGDPPKLIADSKKAQKDLSWTPKYPDLESMIEHAWKAMN